MPVLGAARRCLHSRRGTDETGVDQSKDAFRAPCYDDLMSSEQSVLRGSALSRPGHGAQGTKPSLQGVGDATGAARSRGGAGVGMLGELSSGVSGGEQCAPDSPRSEAESGALGGVFFTALRRSQVGGGAWEGAWIERHSQWERVQD